MQEILAAVWLELKAAFIATSILLWVGVIVVALAFLLMVGNE
jgi:hypothetical protein